MRALILKSMLFALGSIAALASGSGSATSGSSNGDDLGTASDGVDGAATAAAATLVN